MHIGPILSTLRRHKITAFLLVVEIALTCAIVCNAVFLISQRLERMKMPSGVAEHQLVMVQVTNTAPVKDAIARSAADLAALRRIPGVRKATLASQVPFTNSSSNSSIKLDPKQKLPTLNATQYMGEDLIGTFGVQLVAGRNFRPDEYMDFDTVIHNMDLLRTRTPTVIITRPMAERLWPGQSPLGKQLYMGPISVRVVGVVKDLVRPSLFLGDNAAQWSMIFPLRRDVNDASRYVLRTDPNDRQRVMAAAVKVLRKLDPHRIILEKKTFDQIRADFFRNDRAMAGTLLGVIIALLTVTALGIVGLASFWVAQRRRTIGVRRALGATARRYPALLPDRELPAGDHRHRPGHGAGLGYQPVPDAALRVAAPAVVLPAHRCHRTVADRPGGGARPGAARLQRAAGGGDAIGMTPEDRN